MPFVERWDKPVRKECVGKKRELGQQEEEPLRHPWGGGERIQTAGKAQSDHVTLGGTLGMPAVVPSRLPSVGDRTLRAL